MTGDDPGSRSSLRNASVLILTDESEFARLLTACWQAERQAPGITVLSSELWKDHEAVPHDLVVVGPVLEGKLPGILRSLEPASAVILCVPADSRDFGQLRSRYPRLVHIPLREDWAQTLLLVAGESLRRAEALRLSKASGTASGEERKSGYSGPLHDGHETQRQQRADLHAGQCRTVASGAWPTLFAIPRAD